jgi:hypothetical protein
MKCHLIQTYLLGVEKPGQPPADVQAHLTACAACREWQRQLAQLEQNVGLLPVPASTGKADLLRRLRSEPFAGGVYRGRNKERGLQKLSVATALAAGLLLFTFGLWVWQREPPRKAPTGYALVAGLMQRNLRMAPGGELAKRIETLADVADDLQGETRLLARVAPAEDLEALTRMYERVVREGIEKLALKLPAGQGRQVLEPIRERLAQPGGEAAASPAAVERARQFRRNRVLVEKLVQYSLYLAAEEEPLRRAGHCTDLAESMADEMQKSAQNKEGPRVLELGQHLNALLRYGVAANMNAVRGQAEVIPPESSLAKQLQEVQERTKLAVGPLEQYLEQATDGGDRQELRAALKAVHDGRMEVDRAVKGRSKLGPREKS